MRNWIKIGMGMWFFATTPLCLAQAGSEGWADLSEASMQSTSLRIDDRPFPSVRGVGMAQALESTADDIDAAIFNPAGIGGQHTAKAAVPYLKRLYFPYAALTANLNTVDLYREFGTSGGAASSAIGRAIVDAQAGRDQYARAVLTSGIVLGRTMIIPIHDYQVAAVSQGNDSGLIDANYRRTTGWGVGGSIQSPDERIAFGYFGYQVSREQIQGTFDYSAFGGLEALKAVMQPYSRTFTGTGHNIGAMWRPGILWHPNFGLALSDVGNTHFQSSDGEPPQTVKQNLAFGSSIRPELSKDLSLLVSLGTDRLNDLAIAGPKKTHLGLELTFAGLGNYAHFSLRAGVSSGGGSVGAGAHFGLIGFQAALQNLDVGAGNEKVVEQRRSFNLYVNVAEF